MNKPSIIIIIILLLLVIGLGGYIGYEKYTETKDENTTTVIDDVSVNLNIFYQIGDTLTKLDNAFNDPNSTFFGYIYNSDKIEAKKFDGRAALFVSVHDDLVGNNTTQYLLGASVKSKFEKIFGKNLQYAPGNINAGSYYNIN